MVPPGGSAGPWPSPQLEGNVTRLGLEGFTSGLAVMLGRMEMPVGLSYALTWLSPDGLNRFSPGGSEYTGFLTLQREGGAPLLPPHPPPPAVKQSQGERTGFQHGETQLSAAIHHPSSFMGLSVVPQSQPSGVSAFSQGLVAGWPDLWTRKVWVGPH